VAEVLLSRSLRLSIFEAAAAGDTSQVQARLAENPDLARALAPDGFSALHLAAFFAHPETLAALLAGGAPPNIVARNPMQVTPLHSAVACGDAERAQAMAALLLDHGADPNIAQQDGFTPLTAAAQDGNLPLTRLLLNAGARRNACNANNKTALDVAREHGHAALFTLLEPMTGCYELGVSRCGRSRPCAAPMTNINPSCYLV
jgi:ankyrin repeat protein